MNTFLRFTLFSFYLIHISKSCSPIPGYKYATLEDQANNASAVLHGRVKEIIGGDYVNDSVIIFSVNNYLKGCGDSEVIVSGFQGSSLCGSGLPDVEDELILFACPDSDGTDDLQKWKLNTFDMFTGALFMKYYENQTLNDIISNELKLMNGTNDCLSMGQCLNKKNNNDQNEIAVHPEPEELVDNWNFPYDDDDSNYGMMDNDDSWGDY
jgi:hypothetical protein